MLHLTSKIYVIIGVVAGAVLAALPTYYYGISVGKHQAKLEQMQANVDAYFKREGIDNEVDRLDRYTICIQLGGVQDFCEQLRRMEEATTSE